MSTVAAAQGLRIPISDPTCAKLVRASSAPRWPLRPARSWDQVRAFVVMLNSLGVVSARALGRSWRDCAIALAVVSALVTPAADVLSMFLIAIPITALFFGPDRVAASTTAARQGAPDMFALTFEMHTSDWQMDLSRYDPRRIVRDAIDDERRLQDPSFAGVLRIAISGSTNGQSPSRRFRRLQRC